MTSRLTIQQIEFVRMPRRTVREQLADRLATWLFAGALARARRAQELDTCREICSAMQRRQRSAKTLIREKDLQLDIRRTSCENAIEKIRAANLEPWLAARLQNSEYEGELFAVGTWVWRIGEFARTGVWTL